MSEFLFYLQMTNFETPTNHRHLQHTHVNQQQFIDEHEHEYVDEHEHEYEYVDKHEHEYEYVDVNNEGKEQGTSDVFSYRHDEFTWQRGCYVLVQEKWKIQHGDLGLKLWSGTGKKVYVSLGLQAWLALQVENVTQ